MQHLCMVTVTRLIVMIILKCMELLTHCSVYQELTNF